jgi:hypothetical protein
MTARKLTAVLAALCLVLFNAQAFAANAYITEFGVVGTAANASQVQIAALPPLNHQKVDFSAGAANATAFNAQTKYIRVHCDAACSIRIGGTATTSYLRIPTDAAEYFGVQPGAVLSVIANP